jgi:hypothetical protein
MRINARPVDSDFVAKIWAGYTAGFRVPVRFQHRFTLFDTIENRAMRWRIPFSPQRWE